MATVRLAEVYDEDSLTSVILFVQNLLNEGEVRWVWFAGHCCATMIALSVISRTHVRIATGHRPRRRSQTRRAPALRQRRTSSLRLAVLRSSLL